MKAWVFGDNVDTDAIVPGRYMKFGIDEIARHCLETVDPGFAKAVRKGDAVVAGRNFGAGSSREHAVWAIKDFGFDAVIAPSFSDIFYANCTKNGLLPVILGEEECRGVAAAGKARIDVDDQTVDYAGGVVRFEIDEEVKHRMLQGLDDIAVTLKAVESIDAFEASGAADHGPVTTQL